MSATRRLARLLAGRSFWAPASQQQQQGALLAPELPSVAGAARQLQSVADTDAPPHQPSHFPPVSPKFAPGSMHHISGHLLSSCPSFQPATGGGARVSGHLLSSCHSFWPATGAGGVRHISGITQPSPAKLNEVMEIDKLMGKTPEEISDIWLQYHADPSKGRVGSVMTAEEYQALRTRAKESPLFALPLAKPGGGFLTMVSQCQMPFILLTTLEEYKRHTDAAPAHMTITVYPELVDAKGVALLRGDVVSDKVVSMQEGRLLLEVLRAFYTSEEDYKLVHTFNHNPDEFDFAAVLKKMGHDNTPAAAT